MKILLNTTSPYARIAKIALLEKGVTDLEEEIVVPWKDPPALLAANTAARVPAVVTDEGVSLTESWLILTWLEKTRPEPALVYGDIPQVLRRAGVAFGVVEASVHIIIGRMMASGDPNDTASDELPVSLRRRRSILTGLAALAKDPPVYDGGTPDLSVILAVVALDYAKLRFGQFDWLESYPVLDALQAKVADRPAFKSSLPHL